MKKQNKGITLVALIVTIIILLMEVVKLNICFMEHLLMMKKIIT